MGKFKHDFESLGDSVGFDEKKQKEIVKAFNDALDATPEKHGTKSKILEKTIQLARQRGILHDEHDHFFAAFFLSEFISRKTMESNDLTKATMKAVAATFAKQLRDQGIEIEDLPLDKMIDEVRENIAGDSDSICSEDHEEHIKEIMKLDPEKIINKEKLLQHMESDQNDF